MSRRGGGWGDKSILAIQKQKKKMCVLEHRSGQKKKKKVFTIFRRTCAERQRRGWMSCEQSGTSSQSVNT